MPVIFVDDGLTVKVFTREHSPRHVHVFCRDGEAIIVIGAPGEGPEVRAAYHLRTWEVARAPEIVRENQAAFRDACRRYHGD